MRIGLGWPDMRNSEAEGLPVAGNHGNLRSMAV